MSLFDQLYEGAVLLDANACIVWMNDKYKALLGWNGTEPVEGRPVEEVIPNSRMREVVQTGRADLLDIFLIENRQLVVSRIPIRDDNGQVTGAVGFILFDRIQSLKPLVEKFQGLQADLDKAKRQLADARRAKYGFSQFIGNSPKVRELKRQARRAADRDSTVLLLGETGTGKELLAHAIHGAGPRARRPMVRVNMAAIPENLLEAELFGVAPGAFTGAGRRHRDGKIKLADGGTLFLDEIGEMPLALQGKLLRVLQEREIEPLGSNKVIEVDVRVIAATSRNLVKMVEDGSFRSDLYYRLNVLPLRLPRLSERLEDLDLLCEALLERISIESGAPVPEVTDEAIEFLRQHDWPGNVRELHNVLEQAVALHDERVLDVEHFRAVLMPANATAKADSKAAPALSADTTGSAASGDAADQAGCASDAIRPLRDVLADAEREAIRAALEKAGGVKVQAAKALGISRAQFYEKLRLHNLD